MMFGLLLSAMAVIAGRQKQSMETVKDSRQSKTMLALREEAYISQKAQEWGGRL
jgi:hypothetical protein